MTNNNDNNDSTNNADNHDGASRAPAQGRIVQH